MWLLRNKWLWISVLALILIIFLVYRIKKSRQTTDPYNYSGASQQENQQGAGSYQQGYQAGTSATTGAVAGVGFALRDPVTFIIWLFT